MVFRSICATTVLMTALFSSSAVHAEQSEIKVAIAELHVKPADNAKTMIRLGRGREVSVISTSNDGQWVQIATKVEHGEDDISFQGWVDASALSGKASPKTKENDAPAASDATWVDPPADNKPAPAAAKSDDWGAAPAAKPAPAPASDDSSWDSSATAKSDSKKSVDSTPAASSSADADWFSSDSSSTAKADSGASSSSSSSSNPW